MPVNFNVLQLIFSIAASVGGAIAPSDDLQPSLPPGELIDVGGCRMHVYSAGSGSPTIVFDHSLGSPSWANYRVFAELAQTNRVVVCDRPGYGWSEPSPQARTSEQIVREFATLLSRADIEPPYILVGDSFGGYTTRLYASKFPEKVAGMVLTHSLHEDVVLNFPLSIRLMREIFLISFKLTQWSADLGMVRLADLLGLFEFFKPELQNFPKEELQRIKLSYYNARHWETMFREVLDIYKSSEQMKAVRSLGEMPLVVVSVKNFLQRSPFTAWMPLVEANRTWERMQVELLKLSANSKRIAVENSSHFVWVDQPNAMIQAVREAIAMAEKAKQN